MHKRGSFTLVPGKRSRKLRDSFVQPGAGTLGEREMTTHIEDHQFTSPVATMGEALRDCLSPEALAMLAACLQQSPYNFKIPPASAEQAVVQFHWFHDLLVETVGGDRMSQIIDELCL